MPKALSSTPVWRVSSAAINPQSCKVVRARAEKSPKLPIGVATTYSLPATSLPSILLAVDGGLKEQGYGSSLAASTNEPMAHGAARRGSAVPCGPAVSHRRGVQLGQARRRERDGSPGSGRPHG